MFVWVKLSIELDDALVIREQPTFIKLWSSNIGDVLHKPMNESACEEHESSWIFMNESSHADERCGVACKKKDSNSACLKIIDYGSDSNKN